MPHTREHLQIFMDRLIECGYTQPRTLSHTRIAENMNKKGYKTFRGDYWKAKAIRDFLNNHADKNLRVTA